MNLPDGLLDGSWTLTAWLLFVPLALFAVWQAPWAVPVSYTHLDVYKRQAQDRPYRGPQPVDVIGGILGEFVKRGVLDGDLVALACEDLDGSWRAATLPLPGDGGGG